MICYLHPCLPSALSLKESHLHSINRWLSSQNASNNKEFTISQGKFFDLPAMLVLVSFLRATQNKFTLHSTLLKSRVGVE